MQKKHQTIQPYLCFNVSSTLLLFCLVSAWASGGQARAQGSLFGGPLGGARQAGPGTRRAPRPAVFSSHLVTLHVNGGFDATLDALFAQIPVNYIYALRNPPTNKMRLEFSKAPFDDALNAVLRAYPANPSIQQHLAGNVLSLMQSDAPNQKPDMKARLVTLHLKNVDIRDAFNALFAALGAEHSPVDNLEGRVTLTMRAAPHDRVLAALIKQSPHPLIWQESGSALLIRRK